jgi:hypothetical protein
MGPVCAFRTHGGFRVSGSISISSFVRFAFGNSPSKRSFTVAWGCCLSLHKLTRGVGDGETGRCRSADRCCIALLFPLPSSE